SVFTAISDVESFVSVCKCLGKVAFCSIPICPGKENIGLVINHIYPPTTGKGNGEMVGYDRQLRRTFLQAYSQKPMIPNNVTLTKIGFGGFHCSLNAIERCRGIVHQQRETASIKPNIAYRLNRLQL